MPRQARVAVGNILYHVINRANGRVQIFINDADYIHFEELLFEAKELTGMRILAYCIMPNHFHLVLYPETDMQLGDFMGWLTSTHVRQHRTRTKSIGYGHLYQDRYKSFPIQDDTHAVTVIKYVEQNPLRANLVKRAEDWKWSSLWRREKGSSKQKALLSDLPIDLPKDYLEVVNDTPKKEQLESIRYSVNKGKPYGTLTWVDSMIEKFNISHTLRGPGRPKGS
jgi:putative transposase